MMELRLNNKVLMEALELWLNEVVMRDSISVIAVRHISLGNDEDGIVIEFNRSESLSQSEMLARLTGEKK